MQGITDTIQDLKIIIEVIVPIIAGAGGFLAANYLNMRKLKMEEKASKDQSRNQDEKIHNEIFEKTVDASQKLADILINVVEPLSKRVKMLEEDALTRQSQILELNNKIFELTRTISRKDEEIEDLNRRYLNQVAISQEQEAKIRDQGIKIQEQAKRIGELEEELNRLKGNKNV